MATQNSTTRRKPARPYPTFPLFAHATRRWAKKIKGKFHYFGPWDDPDGALQRYLDQRDDLHAGRTPRAARDGLTVRELVNRFLTAKQHLVDAEELSSWTFRDYHAVCKRLVNAFGRDRLVSDLRSEDFERLRADLAKRFGPETLRSEVGRIRSILKYAYDAGLVDKPGSSA